MHIDEYPTQPLKKISTQRRTPLKAAMACSAIAAFILVLLAFTQGGLIVIALAILSTLTALELSLWLWRGSIRMSSKKVKRHLAHSMKQGVTNPSRRMDKTLIDMGTAAEKERLFVEETPHPMSVCRWWILLILLIAGFGFGMYMWIWAWLYLLGAWIIGAAVCGIKLLEWQLEAFGVTDRRLIEIKHIFPIHYNAVPLHQITDISHREPLLAIVLAFLRIIDTPYGTIIVETAGQKQQIEEIHFVRNVSEAMQLVMYNVLPPKLQAKIKQTVKDR